MSAFNKIVELIKKNESFVLEAGAGSGKTFTLIQTINYLIENKGVQLKYDNQNIVCITYTNVAKNEIIDRLENNPLVLVNTIHEFLWNCIKNYQKQLLIELDRLNIQMHEKKPDDFELNLLDRIKDKEVVYNDSSYRDFEKGQLHHDDVITLTKFMFENYEVLTSILSSKFPFILIDEYQDTAKETVQALVDYLLAKNKAKVFLGFYGDSYQKIYDGGIGALDQYIDDHKLTLISKEENYRSTVEVINLLNKVRDNIRQVPPPGKEFKQGSITFINCTNYPPKPKTGIIEYEKSLVPQKNTNYDKVIAKLSAQGWNFDEDSDDKVLIIANSRVAERGKFGALYKVFTVRYGEGATDAVMKRENIFTKFFLGSIDKKTSKERKSGIEHLISYWKAKDYNGVMYFLNTQGQLNKTEPENDDSYFYLRKHQDKNKIAEKLAELEALRETGTVKQVFDFTIENKLVKLADSIINYQKRVATNLDDIDDLEERAKYERDITFYNSLMALPYVEFINLFKHTQNQTVFSTKHGTKGDEYRNVLVVIDDTSWKQKYNFGNYFNGQDTDGERTLRTKNLFYVSCSRAMENLVVLALSEMNTSSMTTINNWFEDKNVYLIDNY